MFSDILFEKRKKYYIEKYDINRGKWEQNRIVANLVFAIVVLIIAYGFGLGLVKSVLLGMAVFIIMFKFSYLELTKMDTKVAKYLALTLPQITTTFVALSAYYDSVINILDYSKSYVDDKYYSMRIDAFLEKTKKNPEKIDDHLFALFSDLPSVNALFLSRSMVDLKNKGYDQELLISLMKSVETESASIIAAKLEAIPLAFIKFGTFPIMITMLLMMQLVMGLMGYVFI